MQKESSVKVISYELNLARTTPSVRILAHRNGDIGYNDGVTVIANSIYQVLSSYFYTKYQIIPSNKCQQCTDILLSEVEQEIRRCLDKILPLPPFSSYNISHTRGGQPSFLFNLGLAGPCFRRFRDI